MCLIHYANQTITNPTLINMVGCMLSNSSLPISLWMHVFKFDMYLLNQILSKVVSIDTIFYMWTINCMFGRHKIIILDS